MDVRLKILTCAHRWLPFSTRGDMESAAFRDPVLDLSCIINFYGRINLLEGILYSLAEQDLSTERYEIILVEDRGGTEEGKRVSERFRKRIPVKYFALAENYGQMGYSRNMGLFKTEGRYILFLDDDTVILQRNFLSALIAEFEQIEADAVVPCGRASYCLLKGKYSFHDPYFPSNRCTAYRRGVLKELGGFLSDIIGQEDVELAIRFLAAGKKYYHSTRLDYCHPPLVTGNLNKASAVGMSFAKLRSRYPFLIWLMLLMNGSRFLPLLLIPVKTKWRMQGKFSLGFVRGVVYSMFGKKQTYT